jgi:hypothetical protein
MLIWRCRLGLVFGNWGSLEATG